MIQLFHVCTTKRSKDSFTTFKFFVEIISSNSFYMTITHNENFTTVFDNTGLVTITWNCKRYEFF